MSNQDCVRKGSGDQRQMGVFRALTIIASPALILAGEGQERTLGLCIRSPREQHLQNRYDWSKKEFMLIQKVGSAERETESWRKIRCTKDYIGEVREWFAFIEGIRFAGKQLPISVRKETVEYIEMLLTADLVRLNERSAK